MPEAAPAAAVVADPDDEKSAAQLSALQREAERRQADLDYVQQTAEQDPRLVATLIKHWMNP
jgi:flagellar M-ring protein FliF